MKNPIAKDLYYVGVNDHKIDLFEGHFIVPHGVSYNSYIIKDNDIAIFDTVDKHFFKEWIANVKKVLGKEKPKYLIIQHMEPDHSANIMKFLEVYPETTVVASQMGFAFMQNYFHELPKNRQAIKEGDKINLGKHELTFVSAPMVHWPEVMVTYDSYIKTLFSADGFGKFGALDYKDPEGWACEARRYYFGIVGKYGVQVQNLLKKAANLQIERICPLHGPVLDKDLGYYLDLYNTWSSYKSEKEGVAILYTSVYGHTKEACEYLNSKITCKHELIDLAREDLYECVETAFEFSKIVLATTTYNASIFPFMHDLLIHLVERNWQNKIVGIIENGTWVPNAANVIKDLLKNCKNLTILDPIVTIKSSMDENNKKRLDELASKLSK